MTERTSAFGAQPEILIVEDSHIEAELLRRTLVRAGYAITIAYNGEEGLQAAQAHRPAIMLSDINMPVMNGYELCQAIKLDEALWNVPVILLTVLTEPEDIMEALNSGADGYITKPYVEVILLERIRALIARPLNRKRTEERRSEVVEYNGKQHTITGGSQQVLNLLFSVYDNSLSQNRDLIRIQSQLNLLNESLEDQVIERTKALRESEEKFHIIFEEAKDGIVLINENGMIVNANPEFQQQTGRTLDQLLQMRIWELSPADKSELAERRFREIWATGMGAADDLGFQKPGGELVQIEFRSKAINVGGQRYLQSISRDITARKKAEAELAWRTAFFEALVQSSMDGILVVDSQGKKVLQNQRMIELWKIPRALADDPDDTAQLEFVTNQTADPGQFVDKVRYLYAHPEESSLDEITTNEGMVFDRYSAPVMDDAGVNYGRIWSFRDITERKAAQKQLQLGAQLLDSTADSILAFDLDGNLIYLNEATWRERGYTRDEMMVMNLHDLDTPEAAKHIKSNIRKLMQQGSSTFESAHRRKDGTPFPVEISARFVELDGRKIILASVRDITERQQAEDALRIRTQQLEEAQEIGHIGNWEWDVTSNTSTWSREMYRIFDRDPDTFQFTLENFLTVPHPDDRAQVQEIVRKSLQKIEPSEFDFRITTSTGALRWIHEKSKISADSNGKPVRAYGTCQDITAGKHAEEVLRESEQKFRAVFDHTSDGIIVMNIDVHRVSFANAGMEKMLGYGTGELTGLELSRLHPPEALVQARARFDSDAEGGLSTVQDMPMLTKDGHVMYADLNGSPVEIGGQRYLLGSFRDATERRHNEETLHRLNRTLRALSAGNHALVHARNEDALLKNMCRATTEAGYVLAWVGFAVQDENKSIVPMAVYGDSKAYVEKQIITWSEQPSGHGPTGTAVRSGETQIVNDIANDPRMAPWREATAQFGLAASIALPLKEDGKIIGSLTIYAAEKNAFGADQVALLEEMASDLAFGIVTLRTRVEHEQQGAILRESLEQSIQTIADTVEARDPYTAGHQRRVSELAVAIAREMRLPEEQINGIHLAAIVHDLGKIQVPAEILAKPGRLSEIEYALIKQHPQEGYEILKDVKFPWPIADIVWQHHERLDGSGYPQGLKGDAILLESRVMAVADVMEAMSSHRPYRAGLGVDAALKEIERGRDSIYDPVVVDACLKLFAENRFTVGSTSS